MSPQTPADWNRLPRAIGPIVAGGRFNAGDMATREIASICGSVGISASAQFLFDCRDHAGVGGLDLG